MEDILSSTVLKFIIAVGIANIITISRLLSPSPLKSESALNDNGPNCVFKRQSIPGPQNLQEVMGKSRLFLGYIMFSTVLTANWD